MNYVAAQLLAAKLDSRGLGPNEFLTTRPDGIQRRGRRQRDLDVHERRDPRRAGVDFHSGQLRAMEEDLFDGDALFGMRDVVES